MPGIANITDCKAEENCGQKVAVAAVCRSGKDPYSSIVTQKVNRKGSAPMGAVTEGGGWPRRYLCVTCDSWKGYARLKIMVAETVNERDKLRLAWGWKRFNNHVSI